MSLTQNFQFIFFDIVYLYLIFHLSSFYLSSLNFSSFIILLIIKNASSMKKIENMKDFKRENKGQH